MAEGARLESVFTGNRNVGSNPTPSASLLQNWLSADRKQEPIALHLRLSGSRPPDFFDPRFHPRRSPSRLFLCGSVLSSKSTEFFGSIFSGAK